MHKILSVGKILLMVMPLSGTAYATVNFPGLSGAHLEGANDFDRLYTQYAKSFSKYYGQAILFSSHLTYPIAKDNLGKFPSFYAGVGLGTAFSNTQAMKSETDPSISSKVVPTILPSAGLSLNLGIGLTSKWDLRISFFPNVPFSLPATTGGYGVSFSSGNGRVRLAYHLLEGGLLQPGVTLAGYAFHNQGGISVSSENISSSYSESGVDTTLTYNVSTSASWKYTGVGGEVRVWYDLLLFHPFVGYSVGMQTGLFNTSIKADGNMAVTITPTTQNSAGNITIDENAIPSFFSHRVMLGAEFELFLVKVGVETQIDIANRLLGLSLGAAFSF